jgi:hypothetical protein
MQTIGKGWFIILAFLWLDVKKDMTGGMWLARYGFESLDVKVKWLERNVLSKILLKNLYALQKHK